jgi:hypothetical protein
MIVGTLLFKPSVKLLSRLSSLAVVYAVYGLKVK